MRTRAMIFVAAAAVTAVASLVSAQTFRNLLGSSGFSARESNQGVALGDYDGDGDTDIFLSSQFVENPIPFLPDLGGPDRCYENVAASFTDRAGALGLADEGFGQGAAWADIDSDGALDLYLVRGVQAAVPDPHKLYRQVGGVFDDSSSTDVGAASAGRSVCWADFDRDGHLDVFVTNGLDSGALPDARVFLFRNDGSGGLTDVAVAVGLEDRRNAHGCAWSDYDNDGDMDLFVANKGFEDPVLGLSDPQANALYHNQLEETGSATFVDVAEAAGLTGIDAVDPGGSSFGCAWADYDNDGWMDLYVTNGFSGVVPFPTPNRLYRNRGDGTFADATLLAFLGDLSTDSSFGVTWGDFDNDGYIDLYVNNASIPVLAVADNDLYRGQGGPLFMFDNIASAARVDASGFAQACASADFNGDGALDIYSINSIPGVELFFEVADALYINDGTQNHFLHLDLIGTESNRSAVGARITIEVNGRQQTREVAAGSGYQSMDDLRVEFGLGGALVAETVTIRWPSGCIQELTDVAADGVVTVVEECLMGARFILRREIGASVGASFPLADYDALPGSARWVDPEPVLDDARFLIYQHPDTVEILMVKEARTVAMSW